MSSYQRATLLTEAHPSFLGKPAGYRGFHYPAKVARTVDVEGKPLVLYEMSDGRDPWPSRADVVRLLDGFTCRQIDSGGGLDQLTIPTGLLDVVSPQATAIGAGFALRAGRITPARADALLIAIGEKHA